MHSLAEACRTGNLKRVEALLAAGGDLYTTTDTGETALYIAATQPASAIVRLLRGHGYRPETVRDHTGTILPFLAKVFDPLDVVEWFASAGVDLGHADRGAMAPLVWACYNGDVDLIKALLRFGADPNSCGALSAVLNSDNIPPDSVDLLVSLLIESGAEPARALRAAIYHGRLDSVEQLLPYIANINAEDHAGHTCLYHAEWQARNRQAILRLLRRHGAQLNRDDSEALPPEAEP